MPNHYELIPNVSVDYAASALILFREITLTGSGYCLTIMDESLMLGKFCNLQFVLNLPNE